MDTPKSKAKRKRHLPTPPSNTDKGDTVSHNGGPVLRSVTFSSDIVETSIGGTQTIGRIKSDPLSMSLSVNGDGPFSVTSSLSERKENIDPTINCGLPIIERKLTYNGIESECNSNEEQSEWQKNNSESLFTPNKDLRRVTVEGHIELSGIGESPALRTPSRRFTLDEKLLSTPECYSAVQMDLPRYELSFDRDGQGSPEQDEDSSSVTVAVRVRPFMQRELSGPVGRCVVSMNNNETCVTTDTGTVHKFTYDFSFWSFDSNHGEYADQDHVYRMLAQPLLTKAFEGYNTCLFAYGQTGSGKSYSIMGHGNEVGIIPRFCEDLFSRAEFTRGSSDKVKVNVEISFFEIYNEKIHDLLASSKDKGGKKPTLKVREHPVLGPYVEGLSTYVTNSFENVEGWINLGNKNRATAATGMNDKSSRSHSVFTLVLTQTKTEEIEGQGHDHSITSKINLVDLAGSERQSQAQTSGQRLRLFITQERAEDSVNWYPVDSRNAPRQQEGANINKSLLTLGKVISSLSEQSLSMSRKKKLFIPYRDSVLTWLLKESLGGNSKTAMIATISPSHHHIDETLSTLRYANQARSIINIARVNEDPKAKIIRELRAEIDRLKGHSIYMTEETHIESLMEIAGLKERLSAKEKEMEEITRSWQQRLKQSEERKVAESKQLEKAGITFKVDNKLPNLVNLNEDPQLSEMLLYVIKEGQTRVGRMCALSRHEIQLNGALIADNHCIINNLDCVVSITPIGDAPTYVNGDLITEPVVLHHGDRVILGGDHYFRFNHPKEVKNRVSGPLQSQEMKDFDFARQELHQVQESRLQAELEEARKQVEEEKVMEVEKARREAEQELHSQKTGYEDKLAQLERELKDQTEEVQKVEQSRQEAHGVIEKLKKQKMMLEQEVIAGRRRQELEAKAAKKVAGQVSTERSKVIILLESEKQKAAERIEKLKQRLTEMNSPSKRHLVVDTQAGKTDLYKVALLLREANKISQLLKKNMNFSREDYLEEDSKLRTLIKVTDVKLGVCTFWPVPKFEEKLLQMRDLYQSDADSSADDEVFHDPEDNWEHDEKMSPSRSPRSRWCSHKSFQSSRLASVSSLSSFKSSMSSGEFSVSSLSCVDQEVQTCSGLQIAAQCKSLVLDHINNCKAFYFEESLADKMLQCCEKILQGVKFMSDFSLQGDARVIDLDENNSLQMTCVRLVTLLQSLTSLTGLWSSMFTNDHRFQSSFVLDLTHKLRDQVKVISNHLVLLFQGLENDLDRLVQESSMKVKDTVLIVVQIIGELALATDTTMLSLDQMTEETDTHMLGTDTYKAFLSGCEALIDKSFQGAIKSLENMEEKTEKYTKMSASKLSVGEVPQNAKILVCTCKLLLSKCQSVQGEVDSSIQEGIDELPPQFYSATYKRSCGMVSYISNLMETVSLLIQSLSPIVEGQDGDIRKVCRCAELIQKGASKFLNVTMKNKNNTLNSCHGDLSDISVLSDTQTEDLEFAVQDVKLAAGSIIECVNKVVDLDRLTVTPRGKRLLPVSPDKGVKSPMNHVRSGSLKRNIHFWNQNGELEKKL